MEPRAVIAATIVAIFQGLPGPLQSFALKRGAAILWFIVLVGVTGAALSNEGRGIGFWASVASGVLALLVGSAILSFVQDARDWTTKALGSLWGVLAHPIPVPVVVVALLLGLAGLTLWRWYSYARAAQVEQFELSHSESLAVQALAEADGNSLTSTEIATTTRLSRLVAQQALAVLHERGFVLKYKKRNTLRFYFSSAGRNYAIEKGYGKRGDHAPQGTSSRSA